MFKKIMWSQILQLDYEQSRLFHSYCQLISNPDTDSERQTEQMIQIWNKAIQDTHLADCLELVDYFIDLEPLDSNLDKRAHISEYLLEEVEKIIIQSGRGNILKRQQELASIEKDQRLQTNEKKEPSMKVISDAGIMDKAKNTASEIVTEVIITMI